MLQKLIYINMDVCEYSYAEMSQTQTPHVFINLQGLICQTHREVEWNCGHSREGMTEDKARSGGGYQDIEEGFALVFIAQQNNYYVCNLRQMQKELERGMKVSSIRTNASYPNDREDRQLGSGGARARL